MNKIELLAVPEGNVFEIESLADLLSGAETREYYQGIFFIPQWVIKTKNRFTPAQILHQYHRLAESALAIGAPPLFVCDHNHNWAEIDLRLPGLDGAQFLSQANEHQSLDFFETVILASVGIVLEQALPWAWSIDAIPHNFVADDRDQFRYIDYEPSHLLSSHHHFLTPEGLVNYALVKFGREKPTLFGQVFDLACSRFPSSIFTFLLSRPYSQLITDPSTDKLALLESTQSKDDLLGLLVAWGATLPEPRATETVQRLGYRAYTKNPEGLRRTLFQIFTETNGSGQAYS